MSKTVEELANEAIEETKKPGFEEMIKDETNIKIFEIMAAMGAQKGEKGPIEFTIEMGRKCYDLRSEEMANELKTGKCKS